MSIILKKMGIILKIQTTKNEKAIKTRFRAASKAPEWKQSFSLTLFWVQHVYDPD
jgi:hypothetical protein